MKIHKEITVANRPFHFEFGELAPQAEMAVLAQYGETVVLATVAISKTDTSLSYFPLSVEFSEKLYSGGRIKGSRWVKREGRPSDELVLKGRLIDRSIRPLFPKTFKRDVQIIVSVLSVDNENDPDMVGMLAVSCALSLSSVPWNGPIASVRVGTANGEFVLNPTNGQMEKSDLDLVVSGRHDKVMMLEAGANQLPEQKMVDAIRLAQKEITTVIDEIVDLQKKHGKKKIVLPEESSDTLVNELKKSHKKQIVEIFTDLANKKEGAYEKHSALVDVLALQYEDAYTKGTIAEAIDTVFKYYMRETVMATKKRVDGRLLDDIRPLSARTGVLPRTHGSALFQRGDTQALTITTLGSPSMELMLESAQGESTKRYLHHYAMPPFSVGETGRFGWPSRREIGHGALAERALLPVIPSVEKFPYTIHLVSEILSSNGSTSMASTCGSTLSLMDAGVPIKEPVAGISVGLVTNNKEFVLLTDIMGVEDFNGDMDFKVAGTKNGITAIQLDIKIDGLTDEIIEQTIHVAHEARMKILAFIKDTLSEPRASLSPYAPKILTIKIPVEKIGEIIGPGGKTIKKIIAETECDVNVDDDGTVTIAHRSLENVTRAKQWIQDMVREIAAGEVFEQAEVKRLMNFGAFVEILPGREGLVHLSQMSVNYVEKPEDVVSVGQKVKVRVREIDELGRINLSMLFGADMEAKRSQASHTSSQRFEKRYDKPNNRFQNSGRYDKRQNRSSYQHPHLREQQ